MRGLAIGLVLVYHFTLGMQGEGLASRLLFKLTSTGWCGVDLFFVLSGFLITGILCDAQESPHRFRNFYARRALRIFPLYYATLAIVFAGLPLLASAARRRSGARRRSDLALVLWLEHPGGTPRFLVSAQPFLVARGRGALLPVLARDHLLVRPQDRDAGLRSDDRRGLAVRLWMVSCRGRSGRLLLDDLPDRRAGHGRFPRTRGPRRLAVSRRWSLTPGRLRSAARLRSDRRGGLAKGLCVS